MVEQKYSRKNAPKKRRKAPVPKEERVFVEVKISVPAGIFKKMKAFGEENEFPMSRLFLTAAYNEFQCKNPFHLDISFPDIEIREGQYIAEGAKIISFLEQFPDFGVGIDTMIFSKDVIGIEDDFVLRLALKALIQVNMVEPVIPRLMHFRYPKEYRFYKLSKSVLDHREKERALGYK